MTSLICQKQPSICRICQIFKVIILQFRKYIFKSVESVKTEFDRYKHEKALFYNGFQSVKSYLSNFDIHFLFHNAK